MELTALAEVTDKASPGFAVDTPVQTDAGAAASASSQNTQSFFGTDQRPPRSRASQVGRRQPVFTCGSASVLMVSHVTD